MATLRASVIGPIWLSAGRSKSEGFVCEYVWGEKMMGTKLAISFSKSYQWIPHQTVHPRPNVERNLKILLNFVNFVNSSSWCPIALGLDIIGAIPSISCRVYKTGSLDSHWHLSTIFKTTQTWQLLRVRESWCQIPTICMITKLAQ